MIVSQALQVSRRDELAVVLHGPEIVNLSAASAIDAFFARSAESPAASPRHLVHFPISLHHIRRRRRSLHIRRA
jgi:hypothetical protein